MITAQLVIYLLGNQDILNMTIEYEWIISAVDTVPTLEDKHDVIKCVHWRCKASENGISADVYGAAQVGEPSDDFIDFSDFENNDSRVLDWFYNDEVSHGVTFKQQQEGNALSALRAKQQPAIVTKRLGYQ